ncbi:phosphoribosyltransferase family protein [Actinomadura sp. 3N508]|uniref:phosphoribosyltransferase family protein n=1 Tax=Actinomadura sp. 3N508 TaxID=3375153 RepID=UPI0037980562
MFSDRRDAGRRLAARLHRYSGTNVLVLGLAGGGLGVAAETAASLGAPLDALVVREITLPDGARVGAISEGRARVLDEDAVRQAKAGDEEIRGLERRVRADARTLGLRLRSGRPRRPLTGRAAIVVDDGAASRPALDVACRDARAEGAARVVVAVPAASPADVDHLRMVADEVVCLLAPAFFTTASDFYLDFRPVSEADITRLIGRAAEYTA